MPPRPASPDSASRPGLGLRGILCPERYEEAREAYQRFLDLYPTHMFADDAALGLAASQEALEEFDAAAAAYEAFAAPAHSGSPLHPQGGDGAAGAPAAWPVR